MTDTEKVASRRRRSTISAGSAAPRATVAIAFVHGMLAGLRQSGHDPAPLLEKAGIVLAPDGAGEQRIPLARYAELYNLINRKLDDEGFGLFSSPIRVGAFEFLCRSIVSAPTLAVAIERSIRYLRLLLPDLVVRLDVHADQALLCISEARQLSIGRVFAFEWLLRLLHGLFSWLVGRRVVLDAVAFPYPRPAHADDYVLIYTAQSTFDAPRLTASFAAKLLDLPIRRDEAALQSFLDGAPGKLTMLYRRDREMVLRVRNALRETLSSAGSLADIAHAMHLSPRTLHRRLEIEGSNFQVIKDALRRDLAIERLGKTRQGLTTIAAELGFADTAAFYRAFVRWTGQAPSHYRKRLQTSSVRFGSTGENLSTAEK